MAKDTPVSLGMHIRLRHKSTDTLLKALNRPLRHPNTSGQLMVVTTKNYSDSTLWQVAAGSSVGEKFTSGQNVDRNQDIRLREIPTGNKLHSHGDRLGYTQEAAHQEVTSWNGQTDFNDDWRVEPRSGDIWFLNRPVRIVHKATGKNLHSHDRSHSDYTAGFQEVTAFSGRDDNDFWIAERDGGVAGEDSSDKSDATDEKGAVGYMLSLACRASSNEVCLNADRYAAALAQFFRDKSHDELCFAIYGHWGRGKTYLMELLGEQLEKTDRENKKPTQVVFFRAWKYPTTPEVWVHLYETLAAAAAGKHPLLTFARNMRVGIAKSGLWPLFVALCGFALIVTPKIAAGKILWETFLPLLGLGGVICVIVMATGIHSTSRRLWHSYLSAARHGEKLGLQATIGKDLKGLLEGWLPAGSPFNFWFILGAIGIACEMAWSIAEWVDFGAKYFPPSSLLKASLECLILISGFGIILVISLVRDAPEKVLLVVDDLDRCDLAQLLHIIESIKLLVEEPAIRSRLQVVMLVEEQVLKAAILEKYRDLWDPSNLDGTDPKLISVRADDVIRENLEKLFSAHFRLERLSEEDIRDLLYGFGTEASFIAQDLRERGRRRDAGLPIAVETAPPDKPEEGEVTSAPKSDRVPSHPNIVHVPLTEDERDALWDAMGELGFADKQRAWGPRAVRALAFRFQLARLILSHLNARHVGPNRLARLIVALTINRDRTDISDPDPVVLLVARQVT